MAHPEAHPASTINQTFVQGAFVQSWGARLAVAFTSALVIPLTKIAVSIPIVVSAAGFLLINASASGTMDTAARTGVMVVRIDGAAVPLSWVAHISPGINDGVTWAISVREPITAGAHTITVEFGVQTAPLILKVDPVANPNMDSCSLVVSEVGA